MGDSAGVIVSQQRQNSTCFDPDRPWSHSWNPSRQSRLYHLVDKYMRQPPVLNSGVRISRRFISRVWTLRKIK
jgi:hypothetical protein